MSVGPSLACAHPAVLLFPDVINETSPNHWATGKSFLSIVHSLQAVHPDIMHGPLGLPAASLNKASPAFHSQVQEHSKVSGQRAGPVTS